MSALKTKQFNLIEDMEISALTLALVERIEGFALKVGNLFQVWARRSTDRRQLSFMSEHMLNDIGLTRYDINKEAEKYFWQK